MCSLPVSVFPGTVTKYRDLPSTRYKRWSNEYSIGVKIYGGRYKPVVLVSVLRGPYQVRRQGPISNKGNI